MNPTRRITIIACETPNFKDKILLGPMATTLNQGDDIQFYLLLEIITVFIRERGREYRLGYPQELLTMIIIMGLA